MTGFERYGLDLIMLALGIVVRLWSMTLSVRGA